MEKRERDLDGWIKIQRSKKSTVVFFTDNCVVLARINNCMICPTSIVPSHILPFFFLPHFLCNQIRFIQHY